MTRTDRWIGIIRTLLNKSIDGEPITMDKILQMNQTMLWNLLNPYLEDTETTTQYPALQKFATGYGKVHGYLSLITIVFGVLTNIVVITILHQKKMRTPTNIILSALALFDSLTMIVYVPFAVKFYIVYSADAVPPEVWTFEWAVFAAFVLSFTATTHTISIWLVVNLAIFRYIQIRKSASSSAVYRRMITLATRLVVVTTLISIIVMIPHYLTHDIYPQTLENNTTFYHLKEYELVSSKTEPLVLANFIVYAVVAKIIPCILMLIFGGLLMYHVGIKAHARRKKLHGAKKKKDHKSSSTTAILLVVIILFLLTECPQGVLMIISLFVPQFYSNVYMSLGDVMDFAALVNNSINFILYCGMSAQFRHIFLRMYIHPVLRLCKRQSQ